MANDSVLESEKEKNEALDRYYREEIAHFVINTLKYLKEEIEKDGMIPTIDEAIERLTLKL